VTVHSGMDTRPFYRAARAARRDAPPTRHRATAHRRRHDRTAVRPEGPRRLARPCPEFCAGDSRTSTSCGSATARCAPRSSGASPR
jgi:hypothetical protein